MYSFISSGLVCYQSRICIYIHCGHLSIMNLERSWSLYIYIYIDKNVFKTTRYIYTWWILVHNESRTLLWSFYPWCIIVCVVLFCLVVFVVASMFFLRCLRRWPHIFKHPPKLRSPFLTVHKRKKKNRVEHPTCWPKHLGTENYRTNTMQHQL